MEKVLVVDHSYHKKTGSFDFMLNILRKRYQIKLVYDEASWKGNEFHLPKESNEDFCAIIFWQNLPLNCLEEAQNLCRNIIYVPMYDAAVQAPRKYWDSLKKIRILSFSLALHKMLISYGLSSTYLKFFPNIAVESTESAKGAFGNDVSIFFWNRVNLLDWDIVKQLLGRADVSKVHIHRAIDPFHKFHRPSEDDEIKYHITYSDWYESKTEFLNTVKNFSVFIAPRHAEGIGHSFLEAMALGKAVVAVNAPTMNEYIEDGENGYLFSLQSPAPIDFSNIAKVRENAIKTIQSGFSIWKQAEEEVLDFVSPVHELQQRLSQADHWNIRHDMETMWTQRIIHLESQIQLLHESISKLETGNKGEDIYARFAFPWSIIKPGGKIVLYGGGVVGKIYLRQISRNPYCHVVAVCDKNPSRTGIVEAPVITIDKLAGLKEYDTVLIAIERQDLAEEIRKDLLLSGVPEDKIKWINPARTR